MQTVSLKLRRTEAQYLQDCVRYDMAKTQDPDELDRLRGLFVKLTVAATACVLCGKGSYTFIDPQGKTYCNLHKTADAEPVIV